MNSLSRRNLLTLSASGAVLAAAGLAGCATSTNPTTGVTTYGLDPSVITTITNAVNAIASYAPTIESIAATAAGLFGPAYSAIVTVGSSAVNAVITALTNLIPSLPVGAKVRFGATPTGVLRGFVKTANGYVPIYSQ